MSFFLNIREHIEENLGPIYSTISLNNPATDKLVTFIIVAPSAERNYYLIVTAGLSKNTFMDDEDEITKTTDDEFIIGMPVSWNAPLDEDAFTRLSSEEMLPFQLLLDLGSYPESVNMKLGFGHTIPWSTCPYPGFNRIMVHFTQISPEFEFFLGPNDETVFFKGVYLIREDEFEYKLNHDSDTLLDLFAENNVTLCLDPERPSVVDNL